MVLLNDPDHGDHVPEFDPDAVVTANDYCIAVGVRHAQDVEITDEAPDPH